MLHHHHSPACSAPSGAARAPGSAYARPMGASVRRAPRSGAPTRASGLPKRPLAADASAAASSRAGPGRQHASGGPSKPPSAPVTQVDFLVLGSGIAGLTYALKVAEYGSVAVVTKDHAAEGCTAYAQGGVCAVLDASDSVESHVEDTMIAGAFLNDRKAVEVVCREGPPRVLELVRLGADFTRNPDGSLHLTREGGHTNRRIVHAADLTGREIERALLAAARAHPAITLYEHHLATELVVESQGPGGVPHCFGADVLDQRAAAAAGGAAGAGGGMRRFLALSTMLATGGAGQVYPSTTNPGVATGDGMAMAYRAGAAMSNMEFVQFHPTALYSPPAPGAAAAERTFLITEAVRGEGGLLFNLKGERFMPGYDARGELAPRDVVARAIQDQMLAAGAPHVLLDISHKRAGDVLSHFPNVAARCRADGIDITRDPIPVLPAQHYMCGGVVAGLRAETSIQGLFACGEVACSGLHGANRLASNSLLEGLVFADRAVGPSVAHAEYAASACARQLRAAAAGADFAGRRGALLLADDAAAWVAATRSRVRDLMWQAAGIVRRAPALAAAQEELAAACLDLQARSARYGVSTPLVELGNLLTVAELIVACARQRTESRGLHFSPDFPLTGAEPRPSVITAPLSLRHAQLLARSSSSSGGSGDGEEEVVPAPAAVGSAKAAGVASPAGSPRAGSGKKAAFARDLSVRSLNEPAE